MDARRRNGKETHGVRVGQPIALTSYPATDAMGLLDLARICRHPTPTVHAAADGRGRDHHYALPLRPGRLQSALHSQLGLAIFLGGSF